MSDRKSLGSIVCSICAESSWEKVETGAAVFTLVSPKREMWCRGLSRVELCDSRPWSLGGRFPLVAVTAPVSQSA